MYIQPLQSVVALLYTFARVMVPNVDDWFRPPQSSTKAHDLFVANGEICFPKSVVNRLHSSAAELAQASFPMLGYGHHAVGPPQVPQKKRLHRGKECSSPSLRR